MIRKISMAVAMMVVALFLFGITANVLAETEWEKKHPRRTQVNRRLNNQNRRINNRVRNGKMTQAQASRLHKNDRNIRGEERGMAKQNGGHITRQEQKTLNQQENKNSREIGK